MRFVGVLSFIVCVMVACIGCKSTGVDKNFMQYSPERSIITNDITDMPARTTAERLDEDDYIPRKFADLDPRSQLGRPHPHEFVKRGVKKVTIVRFKMDIGLLATEGLVGQWPTHILLNTGALVEAKCYLLDFNGINGWIGEAILPYEKQVFEGAKFLNFNRLCKWAYDFKAEEILFNRRAYNDDKAYREKLLKEYGSNLPESAFELETGSLAWENFVSPINKKIEAGILNAFFMKDTGEVWYSQVSETVFKQTASRGEEFSFFTRYFKAVGSISLSAAAFSGYGVASNIIAPIVEVAFKEGEGCYMEAFTRRRNMVYIVRYIANIYGANLELLYNRVMDLEMKNFLSGSE